MNRNPLIPFALIAIAGIGLIFFLSFMGIQNIEEQAEEGEEGEGVDLTELAPEEIYQQAGCISCHGENYEGISGPSLVGVGDKLSTDEIKDILVNGKGIMPANLVPEESLDVMAEWLTTLE